MNRLFFFGLLLLAVFNCVVCKVKKNSNAYRNVCLKHSKQSLRLDGRTNRNNEEVENARSCMKKMTKILKSANFRETVNAIENLEEILKETDLTESTTLSEDGLVAFLYKLKQPFKGLQIYADENSVSPDVSSLNKKVSVQLPQELYVESNNTIVFCMLTWSNRNGTTAGELYEDRLVGLSVRGKNISNLQEPVNITITLSSRINANQTLSCVFLNFSTQTFSKDGCTTTWELGQSSVTCSCDHLTYFGVLVVLDPPSTEDQKILAYITLTGCSLSLVALALTVVLFLLNRKARDDVSVKIHLNLSVALILLNVFFLCSHAAAAAASAGLCLYVALSLHYSLLVTFGWMALEGFHLYLLLVKVFNIYVRRYLLKLCMVGWGVPAVIVLLVVITNRNSYGLFPLDSVNSNSTSICYITNNTVKMITTVGVFSFVFVFNISILGVTVRRFVSLHKTKEFGERNSSRAKRDICSLLGIVTLLGITWGLVFFSFGRLTTAALYPFCILNSLQGVFIFLWFVMSMKKSGNSTPKMSSSVTRSTNG